MNPNQPAFPFNTKQDPEFSGMDLRTYIATACLQGLLANSSFVSSMAKEAGSTTVAYRGMAKVAAMGADALIAELNKETK